MSENDAELVGQSLSGSPGADDAFARLVARYRPAIYGLAFAATGSIAEAEAMNFLALKEIQGKEDVQVLRWPQEFLNTFKKVWDEEAARLASENANFKKVWDSMQSFRKGYDLWEKYQKLEVE